MKNPPPRVHDSPHPFIVPGRPGKKVAVGEMLARDERIIFGPLFTLF